MGDIVCALLDKRDGIFRVLLDKRDVDSKRCRGLASVAAVWDEHTVYSGNTVYSGTHTTTCRPDNGKPHRHSMEFKKQFKKTAYLLYLPQSRT